MNGPSMFGAELRQWIRSDAPDLMHAAASNTDLDAQFCDADLTTIAAAELFIDNVLTGNSATRHNFAIVVNGVVVGIVGLSHIEHRHDTAWVSYWLADEARGRGIAARAVRNVATWAFDDLQLHRLELGHRVNNPSSCAVALRAGFEREAIEREKLRYGTERFDVETHSRLATDAIPFRGTEID